MPEKPIEKNIRAAIYARVSTKEQAEKKLSIHEVQIPECKDLIKEKSWIYARTYIDEGFDGNAFKNRPKLQKMLIEDIDDYDVVIVWSFDRLVRDDPYTEANIFKVLDQNKKQVTSVLQREEIVSSDEYDPKSLNVATHRKFRSMQVSYDSLTRRERFMKTKARVVLGGKHIAEPPYGYKMIREIDPNNQRRTIGYRAPDEQEAMILKRIFEERVLVGKSCRKIAFDLNEDGIETRKGKWWSGPSINQRLRNPLPCGYIVWHKSEDRKYGDGRIKRIFPEKEWKLIPVDRKAEKYYKTIIDKDLYQKAQEIREKNKEIGGRGMGSIKNFLTGLIRCPICASSMVKTSLYRTKHDSYGKGYFICQNWHNKKKCISARYPSQTIEKIVLEKVKDFINDPEAFEEYLKEKNTTGSREKEKELKMLNNKIEKTKNIIMQANIKYLDGKIKENHRDDILAKMEPDLQKIQERCSKLEQEMQSYVKLDNEKKSLKELSNQIKEDFDKLTPKQLKPICQILIKEVVPETTPTKIGRRIKCPKINIIWKNPAIMEQECAYPK